MTEGELITEIGRRLAAAAPAGSRVVLFGSRARDAADASSDYDVLVIEPTVENSAAESTRLREELDDLRAPIDVLVVAEARVGCLPTPEHLEVARLLLEKASGDLSALRVLAVDPAQADHVVGFHAQQAVEKSIKAVLASREVELPMTHDLGYLVTLCADDLEPLPADVAGSRWLTPWAGGWRYDTESSPIDRELAVRVADSAFDWARSRVDAPPE